MMLVALAAMFCSKVNPTGRTAVSAPVADRIRVAGTAAAATPSNLSARPAFFYRADSRSERRSRAARRVQPTKRRALYVIHSTMNFGGSKISRRTFAETVASLTAGRRRCDHEQDTGATTRSHYPRGALLCRIRDYEAGNAPSVTGMAYPSSYDPDEGESHDNLVKRFAPPSGISAARLDGDGFLSGRAGEISRDLCTRRRCATSANPCGRSRASGKKSLGTAASVPA